MSDISYSTERTSAVNPELVKITGRMSHGKMKLEFIMPTTRAELPVAQAKVRRELAAMAVELGAGR